MKIKEAISSAILVVLLTAPTAWGQDSIRAAMEAANKEWSAAYNSMNGQAFPALYTGNLARFLAYVALLVFGAVALAWWGFLAWLIWRVI